MGVIFVDAKKIAASDDPQPKWGTLYRSDETGSKYRSVGKTVLYGSGLADLVAVRGAFRCGSRVVLLHCRRFCELIHLSVS